MAICDLPTDLIREINSYLDVYGSSAFRSTCSTIDNDLKGIKSAKPVFFKFIDMYYINIPEYPNAYLINSDTLQFKIEYKLYDSFLNVYPEPITEYKIYVYRKNNLGLSANSISVSYESYKLVKRSYSDYCLYKREHQELKELILKKQENKKKNSSTWKKW